MLQFLSKPFNQEQSVLQVKKMEIFIKCQLRDKDTHEFASQIISGPFSQIKA